MQSQRDDLPERLSLIIAVEPVVAEFVYRERARRLHQMAEAEADPTLRGNLLMLAERYVELGAIVA
jgi:hypothetical protein